MFKLSENFRKYPIKRTDYTRSVGKLLPHRVSQVFQELGFGTEIALGQENDVDLKVYNEEGHLILIAEILNWSLFSLLAIKRKKNIIDNLLKYDCKKFLIYTCLHNESILNDLSKYEISLVKIGYQLQPKHFYDFFASKNQIELRKIDSRETGQDIKSKILQYLQSSNVEVLSSTFDGPEITIRNYNQISRR